MFDMQLIPIHTLLLPDGQVLSYGTDDKGDQGGDVSIVTAYSLNKRA